MNERERETKLQIRVDIRAGMLMTLRDESRHWRRKLQNCKWSWWRALITSQNHSSVGELILYAWSVQVLSMFGMWAISVRWVAMSLFVGRDTGTTWFVDGIVGVRLRMLQQRTNMGTMTTSCKSLWFLPERLYKLRVVYTCCTSCTWSILIQRPQEEVCSM